MVKRKSLEAPRRILGAFPVRGRGRAPRIRRPWPSVFVLSCGLLLMLAAPPARALSVEPALSPEASEPAVRTRAFRSKRGRCDAVVARSIDPSDPLMVCGFAGDRSECAYFHRDRTDLGGEACSVSGPMTKGLTRVSCPSGASLELDLDPATLELSLFRFFPGPDAAFRLPLVCEGMQPWLRQGIQ